MSSWQPLGEDEEEDEEVDEQEELAEFVGEGEGEGDEEEPGSKSSQRSASGAASTQPDEDEDEGGREGETDSNGTEATTFVIQPEATHITFGTFTDGLPKRDIQVLARRGAPLHKATTTVTTSEGISDEGSSQAQWWENMQPSMLEWTPSVEEVTAELRTVRDMRGKKLPGRRPLSSQESLASANRKSAVRTLIPQHKDVDAIDVLQPDSETRCVVGERVFQLPKDSPFQRVSFPLRDVYWHGHLPADASIVALKADIAATWRGLLEHHYNVTDATLANSRLLILVPDTCTRQYRKLVLSVALEEMGFAHAAVHHENVCASFGAGLSVACVVNVQHHMTQVSCVVDGLSVTSSRRLLPYGSATTAHACFQQLQQCGVPLAADVCGARPDDERIVETVFQSNAHLNADECGARDCVVEIRRAGEDAIKHSFTAGPEFVRAPLGLYYPRSLPIPHRIVALCSQANGRDKHDPDDAVYVESKTLIPQVTSNEPLAKRSKPQGVGNSMAVVGTTVAASVPSSSMSSTQPAANPLVNTLRLPTPTIHALDEAVFESITSLQDIGLREKLFVAIVFTGPGASLRLATETLQQRMWLKVPEYFGKVPVDVAVIGNAKEIHPNDLTWRGGAILSTLSGFDDSWIDANTWQSIGIRAARESAAFEW
eukprot:m.66846 g.66846  ORF g.66846 m.66846 type:complete len:657 (-) comp12149_c0_seq1:113-2083(-)